MLNIDGSRGEGGGQILRSSLALAMVTGTPVRLEHIRARRKRPGLMRQHLTAVRAAAAVSQADVDGDEIGSQTLTFAPGSIAPGDHRFAVGTAGSATLVLQTVLPALWTAGAPSALTLEGGTHNPMAPPFDFLVKAYLPLVNRMGPTVTATLQRHGFYPAGGGQFTARVEPSAALQGLDLIERGKVRRRRATAVVAKLPRHIAERELAVIKRKLNWRDDWLQLDEVTNSPGPGNVVMIELESEHVTEVFTSFGQIGRPAEVVANAAVQQCKRYVKGAAPVGEYLTDQLLLPLAIAGSGSFRSVGLSQHATTHIDLIRQFLDLEVQVEETDAEAGTLVRIP